MKDLESQKTIENEPVNQAINILGELAKANKEWCRKEILEIAHRFHEPHSGPEILAMRKTLAPFCKKLRELANIIEGIEGYPALSVAYALDLRGFRRNVDDGAVDPAVAAKHCAVTLRGVDSKYDWPKGPGRDIVNWNVNQLVLDCLILFERFRPGEAKMDTGQSDRPNKDPKSFSALVELVFEEIAGGSPNQDLRNAIRQAFKKLGIYGRAQRKQSTPRK